MREKSSRIQVLLTAFGLAVVSILMLLSPGLFTEYHSLRYVRYSLAGFIILIIIVRKLRA